MGVAGNIRELALEIVHDTHQRKGRSLEKPQIFLYLLMRVYPENMKALLTARIANYCELKTSENYEGQKTCTSLAGGRTASTGNQVDKERALLPDSSWLATLYQMVWRVSFS